MDEFQKAVERLGQRIREIRQAQGLTQRDLADKAGVFDVGEPERGRKVKGGPVNPRLETLHKIALALDVDVEGLFGHSAPDEDAVKISELLEGQNAGAKEQAVRIVEVLVGGKNG